MRRREFIVTLGASIPVAGCLSEIEATDPDINTTGHPDTETCTAGENTSEAFSVGETTDDVNPHQLTVRNDSDGSRTVTLRITDAETDETLLDRSCSLNGGEEISGELQGPAEYGVTVTLSDSGTKHATTIDYFDTCNDYETTVSITRDGTITSETMRTEVDCNAG